MGRTGWASAALAVALIGGASSIPRRASAESPAPPPPAASKPHLPAMPRLQLTWPITPLAFSFSGSELSGYAVGPLQLFRAEALWLATPALQLLTVTSAERAFELDCRLTCQPILQRAFSLEARVPLPQLTPYIAEPHAFVRSSAFYTSQNPHFSRQLSAGFAGALNF